MFENRCSVQHSKDGRQNNVMHLCQELLQNKSASFSRIFGWSQSLEIVKYVSFYAQLKDQYGFCGCFWIIQCWTPAQHLDWNHATSVQGCFNLTKSGRNLGLTHLVFTIYMHISRFYIHSSCLWLYLWSFLSLLHGSIQQLFRWADSASDESSRRKEVIVVCSRKHT